MIKDWRIEDWYVSGIHTGWRIVHDSGWNAEYDSSYVFDMYKYGDYEAEWEAAKKRFRELTA